MAAAAQQPTRDAGTELRQALGQPEPDYSRLSRPSYHAGGYRNAEDERDFAAKDAAWDAHDRAVEAALAGAA